MTGKLLRVRPTCRRHSGQSVVTIIPDCLEYPTVLPGASARVQSASVANTCRCRCIVLGEPLSGSFSVSNTVGPGLVLLAAMSASNTLRLGNTP